MVDTRMASTELTKIFLHRRPPKLDTEVPPALGDAASIVHQVSMEYRRPKVAFVFLLCEHPI